MKTNLFLSILLLSVGAECSPLDWLKSLSSLFRKRQDFVPFSLFILQVQNATYNDWNTTAVANASAFAEMQAHILSMYGGVNATSIPNSFAINGTEYVDCIPQLQQPSVYVLNLTSISTPPGPLTIANVTATTGGAPNGTAGNTNVTSGAPSYLSLNLTDPWGNNITCPAGSMPMRRLTLDWLTQFPTLTDFFYKPPLNHLNTSPELFFGGPNSKSRLGRRFRAAPHKQLGVVERQGMTESLGDNIEARDGTVLDKRGNPVLHLHAYGWETTKQYGGNSWLNLWEPANDFSLSQQWFVSNVSGYPLQTVEGGWGVNKGLWGDRQARLFTYWTADGYDQTGCWDTQCAGFVQINHNWYLGGPWNHYSAQGVSPQWGFQMQWREYEGNWWMYLRGPGAVPEAVGYFPAKTYYPSGLLANYSTDAVFGGEVANYTGGDVHGPMGSGQFAETGWTHAAFQEDVFYIPVDTYYAYGYWADLVGILQAFTRCYTLDITGWQNSGSWGTYFYFGGPGGTNCANGVGP